MWTLTSVQAIGTGVHLQYSLPPGVSSVHKATFMLGATGDLQAVWLNNTSTMGYVIYPNADGSWAGPATLSIAWDGGGYGPAYVPLVAPQSIAGAFVEQAQELNVGLEFNNGQWTVKQ